VGLKGDARTIAALKRALRKLPVTVSARIAARAAPEMGRLARAAFDGGETVYGASRPRGVDGDALSLHKSGATRRALEFVATGRDIRTTRLPRYAKYLIGLYSILPNGPLPIAWRERLETLAAQVLYEELHRGVE
jgi:hypothetical protein